MAVVEEELHDRWTLELGRDRVATTTFDRLLTRYREPHRAYHTLAHVLRVLRSVDDLLAVVPVADPGAVRLAGWYHDAVYDPKAGAGVNEAASASLARRDLEALAQAPGRFADVERLVMVTASHRPSESAADEAVFCDADLAVLGADPQTYTAYVNEVRTEYDFLTTDEWRVGRAAVLRSFLDRETIYSTPPMHALEATARANLTAELASLG
jgi:predicted metal-dependent HD superfamily phosphohydrolase